MEDTSTAIGIHLSKRPIAPILEQSSEKTNPVALQLICILDYYMEERRLYAQIAKVQSPKLLMQLLKFHSFVSFKYYDYRASRKIGDKILRCKFCDLIGPYTNILTHMAINHNAHIGLKMCAYCNREELKVHFSNGSFNHCYDHYIRKRQVIKDDEITEIVANSYGLIKEISEKLNVCTVRNHAFAGTGYTAIEKIAQKYGRDFPTDCIIFQQRNFEKPIKSDILQKEFVRVIGFMYGGNRISRLMSSTAETAGDENVIEISDDDEEYTPNEYEPSSRSSDDNHSSPTYESHNKTVSEMPIVNGIVFNSANDMMPENLVKREQLSSSGLPSNASSPTHSSATTSTRISWTQENDAENFGIFVAQRLQKLPDDIKRRKLEIIIQEAIVQAEKESIT